jgi:hypothetical protein
MSDERCGFVPFPGNGAYGHWSCELGKWHIGPHRFINYTIARVPRFWRVRHFWRIHRCEKRLRSYGKVSDNPRSWPYRRALFPTTYRPVR